VQILHAAVLYFLLVFGAGFVLGVGRVLLVVPLLGERAAELIEMPLMLAVIVATARWVVHHKLDGRKSSALSVGFMAMSFVLLADLTVGIWLRGMSPVEVFLNRDPVSGTAYYAALLLFAVMPTILTRLRHGESLRCTPLEQRVMRSGRERGRSRHLSGIAKKSPVLTVFD